VLKLAAAAAFSALVLAGAEPSCNLVPGWAQTSHAREYQADNLFEYMDGNSEGYLIYGFQKMWGVTCQKGETTFVIDISQMADTDSAYGMFTANRDLRQPQQKIGMGGQIVPRRAIFAKGRYYVEIAANPEGDYTTELREWTAALEKIVEGDSVPPAPLSWFPTDGQQSLRLVPESVLGIRLLKRGYVAQYDYGKGFVALETSPESAAAVFEKLRARFADNWPAKLCDEAFQTEDKYLGRLFVFRKGRYIAGYAVKGEGKDAAALSARLADKM
jgi:hypothetical protein